MNKPRMTEFTTHIRSYGKYGELLDRMKVKSTEKDKAALMIDRLKEMHNITNEDIDKAKLKEVKNEMSFLREERSPIVWKRDARGNII